MPVAGQQPTRLHLEDSESVFWGVVGSPYPDPNDPTKLVRDVKAHTWRYADDSGAANAYVVAFSPTATITEGLMLVIKAAHANSGASTLAVDGAAPIAIQKEGGLALVGGEILSGEIFIVVFDGTHYQMPATALQARKINTTAPLTGGGDLTADRTLAISNFTGDSGLGGAKGAVPAPAAGDAAAGKFLKADGTWSVPLDSSPNTGVYSLAGITIDGGGSVPSTGTKGFIQVPFGCTITGWTIIADQSGSCSIGVKKSTFAGFPTTSSIVASAPPNLSSQQNATSTTLTGWTTTINAGDVLEFDLNSVATCTRITLELQLSRT